MNAPNPPFRAVPGILLLLLVVLLAPACGGGGGGGGGSTTPPPPTTQTITGSMQDRNFVGTQSTTQNVDLGTHLFSALVPSAGGSTFSEYFGTGRSDGTFSIPSVPSGPYYLKWTPSGSYPRYYYLSSATVDLGTDRGYRANTQQSAFATTMLYNWPAGVVLPAEAVTYFPSLWYGYCPEVPSSASMVFDWGSWANDLPNTTDQGWTIGYSKSTVALGTQYAINGIATLQPRTWTDGQSNTLTASFAQKSPNATLPLQLNLDSFRNQLASMGPGATLSSWTGGVGSVTTPISQGLLADPMDMGSISFTTSASGSQSLSLPYVSDGPASLGYFYNFYMYARVSYTLPGRTVLIGIYSDHYFPVPPGRTISPLVGAIRNPRVDGRDFLGSLSGIGTTPTLTWEAPAEGTVSYYALSLVRINATGSPATATIGFGRTQSTSIPVPPGFLVAGNYYFFVITAYTAADFSMQASSRARKLPYGYTTVLSGLVTP